MLTILGFAAGRYCPAHHYVPLGHGKFLYDQSTGQVCSPVPEQGSAVTPCALSSEHRPPKPTSRNAGKNRRLQNGNEHEAENVPRPFSGGLDVPFLLTLDRPAIADIWRTLRSAEGVRGIADPHRSGHYRPRSGGWHGARALLRLPSHGGRGFKLGLNEVQIGLPLPPVILAALRQLVGPRQAERLAVGGLLISPQEALEVGVIDEVAPADQVIERALEWCQGRLALPVEAMAVTRREARADLIELFERDLDPELQKVNAAWWHPETQSTLRTLVEKLGKKK